MKFLFYKIIKMLLNWSFKLKDKIFFLKELSYLLWWWVSIPVSLETIKTNTENDKIKYICEQIFIMINRWETLSRSLTVLDKYFNEWDMKIIASGEWIWELPKVLKQLADEYENLYLIKTRYITAMIYPAILLLIIVLALVIIFKLILPWFINIISSFPNASLPESTKILVSLNHFVQTNWETAIITFIIFFIILALFLSTEEWTKFINLIIIKIPIIWNIFRLYYIVYFLRYFSLLIYSWLPITKVFLHLKWVMKNPFYKQMCDDILINLNKWESFIPIMKEYSTIVPSDVVVLLKVWEETANLEESAKNAIWLYEEEFNKIVDNLSKIIEPIMIVFIWLIVWFIAISIFSVLISVLNSLQT